MSNGKGLSTQWLTNTKGDARKKLEDSIRHSTVALDRLREILEGKLQAVNTTSPKDYDKAAWPYYQADKNGEKRALEDILKLLDF